MIYLFRKFSSEATNFLENMGNSSLPPYLHDVASCCVYPEAQLIVASEPSRELIPYHGNVLQRMYPEEEGDAPVLRKLFEETGTMQDVSRVINGYIVRFARDNGPSYPVMVLRVDRGLMQDHESLIKIRSAALLQDYRAVYTTGANAILVRP